MALRPQDTTVSYRCPACGKSVVSVTGVFALTGDMIKLKCTCGESELLIKNEGEGKVRFTVPCLFCAKPHQYLISRELIMSRELFEFPCKFSGVNTSSIFPEDTHFPLFIKTPWVPYFFARLRSCTTDSTARPGVFSHS